MISAFDVWLIGIADRVLSAAHNLFVLSIFIVVIAAIGVFVCWMVSNDDTSGSAKERENARVAQRSLKRVLTSGLVLMIVMILVGGLLPDSKTMAAMYAVPPIVNSSLVQKEIPQYIRDFLRRLMVGERKEAANDDNGE